MTLAPDALIGSDSIQQIDLGHNRLDSIPAEIFERKTRLRVVNLAANRLR